MRGRLTLEKVNIAINEVATYADANAHLVACPKKKVSLFLQFYSTFSVLNNYFYGMIGC